MLGATASYSPSSSSRTRGITCVPVELDGRHDLLVGQAGHAELQVEPAGVEVAKVRDDLLRDGLRGADVERAVGADIAANDSFGRRPEAALLRDARQCQSATAARTRSAPARRSRRRGRARGRPPAAQAGRTCSRACRNSCGEGREPRRRAADDREHQREPVARGADHRLGAAADADPDRERRLEMRHDVLVVQRRRGSSPPR